MKVCIDRIGEGIAVLIIQEDPSVQIRMPVTLLPQGCREGDILTLTLEPDAAGTAAAKDGVFGLVERMRKRWS